jgi:hypothetical protein
MREIPWNSWVSPYAHFRTVAYPPFSTFPYQTNTLPCKGFKKDECEPSFFLMKNVSLLVKWWWVLDNEEGLWQEIVNLKYVKGSPICSIPKRYNDSLVWNDLLKVRPIYLKGRSFKINNGTFLSL